MTTVLGAGTIAVVPHWPVWAALGLFLAVLVAGTAWVAVNAVRAWRVVRASAGRAYVQVDELQTRVALIERRVDRVTQQTGALQGRIGTFSTTMAQARVLLEAWAEVRSVTDAVRRLVPTK